MTAYVDIELRALRDHISKLTQENKDLKVQIESMRNRPASLKAADNTIKFLQQKLAEAVGRATYSEGKETYDQLRKERDELRKKVAHLSRSSWDMMHDK